MVSVQTTLRLLRPLGQLPEIKLTGRPSRLPEVLSGDETKKCWYAQSAG